MIHENIVIDDIDQAVHVVEPLVDLVRLIGFRKKPCTHVLQQDHIELHNCMGGTVILLHHVFAGTAGIERLAVFPEIKACGKGCRSFLRGLWLSFHGHGYAGGYGCP